MTTEQQEAANVRESVRLEVEDIALVRSFIDLFLEYGAFVSMNNDQEFNELFSRPRAQEAFQAAFLGVFREGIGDDTMTFIRELFNTAMFWRDIAMRKGGAK